MWVIEKLVVCFKQYFAVPGANLENLGLGTRLQCLVK